MDNTTSGAKGRTTKPQDFLGQTVSTKDITINNRKVTIINGTLVAEPFKTAAIPAGKDVAAFYGNINRIMNPPNSERTSTYRSHYTQVARTAQSAGTVHKRPVPYHANAPRNRLAEPQKKAESKTKTNWEIKMGIPNRTNYQFRTTNQISQMAVKDGPMTAHVGFTNDCIVSELTKAYKKPLYR